MNSYPKWICHDCGVEHGRRVPEIATYHNGKCDLCGEPRAVTEPRDYGHLKTALELTDSMICGGESHSAESIAAADAAREELKQLRAEVERLQNLLTPIDEWYAKKLDFYLMEKLLDDNCSQAAERLVRASLAWHSLGEKKAATRCAEIADEYFCGHKDTAHVHSEVGEAIRKEFSL